MVMANRTCIARAWDRAERPPTSVQVAYGFAVPQGASLVNRWLGVQVPSPGSHEGPAPPQGSSGSGVWVESCRVDSGCSVRSCDSARMARAWASGSSLPTACSSGSRLRTPAHPVVPDLVVRVVVVGVCAGVARHPSTVLATAVRRARGASRAIGAAALTRPTGARQR